MHTTCLPNVSCSPLGKGVVLPKGWVVLPERGVSPSRGQSFWEVVPPGVVLLGVGIPWVVLPRGVFYPPDSQSPEGTSGPQTYPTPKPPSWTYRRLWNSTFSQLLLKAVKIRDLTWDWTQVTSDIDRISWTSARVYLRVKWKIRDIQCTCCAIDASRMPLDFSATEQRYPEIFHVILKVYFLSTEITNIKVAFEHLESTSVIASPSNNIPTDSWIYLF